MINLYLHAGSDNHGCEAIVRSTVSILNEKSRLYSLNADKDLKYGLDTICDIKRDTVTVYPKKSLKWFISAAQTKISGKIDLAVKIQRKELLKNIISKEIFLSIGGDNYCYPGTDVLAAVNRNIKKKGAKLVLWGCSVEPKLLKNPEIVADLKEFDLITARESISYNALKTINITAQNKHQFRSIIYMIIAILNVVTTYIAVPYCGILGAATCSCFAYILGQGIVMNIYYYKVTGLDIPLFWKNILKMAIVPGIMMFSGLLINRIYEIDNWIIFLIGIIVFTGIYIVLMYEVSFNEYERSIFREPLKRIIKRIKG